LEEEKNVKREERNSSLFICVISVPLTHPLSPRRVCRNEGNAMPVILNEVKNLCHWLRVNSMKNLIESIS
jgi:hypothetical protein